MEERHWPQSKLCENVRTTTILSAYCNIPTWFGSLGSVALLTGVVLDALVVCESGVIVEVDAERLNVLANGAKWVSFSSVAFDQQRLHSHSKQRYALLVSFQDILVVCNETKASDSRAERGLRCLAVSVEERKVNMERSKRGNHDRRNGVTRKRDRFSRWVYAVDSKRRKSPSFGV